MKPDDTLFKLQKLVIQLSQVKRALYIPGTDHKETDTEHSLTVTLFCWYLAEKHHLDLSIEKILRYALIHDLVEVYAGDVHAFADTAARKEKVVQEKKALEKLTDELSDFNALTQDIASYEQRDDAESLFVWSVDKIQPIIMAELDNWRAYREFPITFERFSSKYAELLLKCSPHIQTVFEEIVEHCKSTYYGQPE